MAISLRLNLGTKSTGAPTGTSIGEVAARLGLATHVPRHWESVGLLDPARAVAGRRRCGPDHLYRVAVILRAKEAGFGLDDIRDMITTSNPVRRAEILRSRRAEPAERIARAEASLELIDGALACQHEDFTSCRRSRP